MAMSDNTENLLYLEVQSGTDQPIIPLVLAATLLPVSFLAPGWVVGGLGITAIGFIWAVRLRVEVSRDSLQIRYRPFMSWTISATEIVWHEAVSYRPMRDWGGWGVRFAGKDRAYTMAGERGVRLRLSDGRHVLIGSRTPERLAAAISRMRDQEGDMKTGKDEP